MVDIIKCVSHIADPSTVIIGLCLSNLFCIYVLLDDKDVSVKGGATEKRCSLIDPYSLFIDSIVKFFSGVDRRNCAEQGVTEEPLRSQLS